MVYFRTILVDGYSPAEIEAALRSAALKRTTSLDITSATLDIGSNKLFIGREGRTSLNFTRLRTSLERFLPKLIIKLPLQNMQSAYQLRLSGSSLFIFAIFAINWGVTLIMFLFFDYPLEQFLTFMFICAFYLGLLFLELSITQRRVRKALALKAKTGI